MAIAHRLFLPPSFGAVLKIIASFSDTDFEQFAAELTALMRLTLIEGGQNALRN